MASPGPCPPPLPSGSISCGRRRGLVPGSPTYLQGGGTGSSGPGEGDRAHAFLGAVASAARRGGAHPLGWVEGRSGEDRAPRSRGRREERRGARPRGPASGAGGRPDSSGLAPRAAPCQPCSCARGQGIGRDRLPGRPEAGNCGWRDAVQKPASSSARPAPRSAPLRSGGGRGAARPGSAAGAAAAASSPPRRPPSWEAGQPRHPRLLQPPLRRHSPSPGPAAPPWRAARAASAGLGPL